MTLNEEHILTVKERKVLKEIIGLKRE